MSAAIAGPPAMSAINAPLASKNFFIAPSIGGSPRSSQLLSSTVAVTGRQPLIAIGTPHQPPFPWPPPGAPGYRCRSLLPLAGPPAGPLTASALSCPSAAQHGRTHALLASRAYFLRPVRRFRRHEDLLRKADDDRTL